MNVKKWAERLKRDIPAVFLSLKDKQTPLLAKVFAAVTVTYALSPIDLIPDFIPVLGLLDDLLLLPALVALTVRLIPRAVWEKNRRLAENLWADGKPKKWYCALPIAAFWLLIALLILRLVLH